MQINSLSQLIADKYRPLWDDYLRFFLLGQQRFAYQEMMVERKSEQLRLLEKALRRNFALPNTLLYRLQQKFAEQNLSLSLLLDLLIVWRYTSSLPSPLSEKQISDIIGYIASPLARMIMALNDENPSIYLPLSSLVSAVLYCWLSEQKSDLLKGTKWSAKQRRSKLKGWLKNSSLLISVVRSYRLKFKSALLLNQLKFWADRLQNNKQRHITFLDEVRIVLYSAFQFVTVRHKSVTIKGV